MQPYPAGLAVSLWKSASQVVSTLLASGAQRQSLETRFYYTEVVIGLNIKRLQLSKNKRKPNNKTQQEVQGMCLS